MEANRGYFTPKGKALEWITKIHRGIYRLSGGFIGHTVFQRAESGAGWLIRPMSVLLLTTTGRTTGLARTVPLPYFEYDGRILLVGSFAGSDKHPAWFLNLRDKPDVQVQKGRARFEARAASLEGADYERMWEKLAGDWPRYRVYQAGTPRKIPLVELIPRG